jgi:aminoglycoside phosphotransferase (APT) family kinase protein
MTQEVFVKSASQAVDLGGGVLAGEVRQARELRMTRLAGTITGTDGNPIAPAVRSERELVFEWIPGRTLAEVLADPMAAGVEDVVATLGGATAALHGVTDPELPAAPRITLTAALEPVNLRFLTGAALAVHTAVGAQRAVVELLDRAVADHGGATLTHNDLRATNVMVTPDRRVRLIDWEFAGTGSAARDVGTLLADFIGFALDAARENRLRPSDQDGASTRSRCYLGLARTFASAYFAARPATFDVPLLAAHVAAGLFHAAVSRAQRDGRRHPLNEASLHLLRRLGQRPESLSALLRVPADNVAGNDVAGNVR